MLYSRKEIAARLGVAHVTVKKWAQKGYLVSSGQLGDRLLTYTRADVERCLKLIPPSHRPNQTEAKRLRRFRAKLKPKAKPTAL
jgi:hypothetical protein